MRAILAADSIEVQQRTHYKWLIGTQAKIWQVQRQITVQHVSVRHSGKPG
jgi:hypothetical protein